MNSRRGFMKLLAALPFCGGLARAKAATTRRVTGPAPFTMEADLEEVRRELEKLKLALDRRDANVATCC